MFDIAVLLVPLALTLSVLWLCCHHRQRAVKHSTPRTIRKFLNPKGVPVSRLLKERASANLRLAHSFNLTNTFVSSSPTVHQTFVTLARNLLKQSQLLGWKKFRDLAIQASQVELSFPSQTSDITVARRYDLFIQCVTLRVILVGLLGVDASVESFAQEDIVLIASHINTIWSLSKDPAPIPPHLLLQLSTTLRCIIPDVEKFPNPVDIVIPAWETLWRVVAVTVAFAYEDRGICEAFSRFSRDPGERSFKNLGSQDFSIQNVVSEAIRLHPPSKHIARIRPKWSCLQNIPVSITDRIYDVWPSLLHRKEYADVVEVQRCGSWSDEASPAAQFDPRKHHPSVLSREQEETLAFSFGCGSLRCVGASWAPIAVAVITSAILELVDGEECIIVPGPGPVVGGRTGWGGWYIKDV